MAPEFVIVGRLRKAHGLRGDLVVEPITDAPAEVFAAGRRLFAGTVDGDLAPDGSSLTIERVHPFGDALLVRFEHIADRALAERWRDRYLLLPSDELTPPAAGEAYVHELVGMRVELMSGDYVGDVVAWFELPQGLVLETTYRDGTVLVPLRPEFVRQLDRAHRLLVIDPPAGLLE
ncbi:MAG TPA: ribosome maturation factor RimM [Gemmatimonadaceae bacterium]|nr:ribosome maturation factor RimM [Gemmatimonadaceae bacterium]